MMRFNYNVFKSNCNSLSKQFNQVHSTCVVYHDICQQSVAKPINKSNLDACSSTSDQHTFQCQNQTCSSDLENNSTNNSSDCKTFSTNTNTHHHHHNHEHGLIYSKRVRSILLLNALLSKPSSRNHDEAKESTSSFLSFGSKWQQIRNYAKKASLKDKKKSGKKMDYSDQELSECIDLNMFRSDLDKVINDLKEEFVANINIRIGTNLELINVDVNGEKYLLKDIARLSKKNNLITVDLSDLPEFAIHVMKAIRDSGMNVNPQQDGSKIYFQQVKSTKEHREALAKNCKTILQKAKDNLRNVQNDYIKKANLKKADRISVDTISNCCDYIRYATVEATNACTEMYDQKVKQLLE